MSQCRGVIDPVANHCHNLAFGLQLANGVGLVGWEDPGEDIFGFDAHLAGHLSGHLNIVSGQQHDA